MNYDAILKPLGVRRVRPIGKRILAQKFSLINGTKPIVFRQDTKAVVIGTADAPFNLAHGETFIVNTKTMTVAATAGYHTGGSSPSTDITGLTTPSFKISADGDPEFHTVTLDHAGKGTGAEIAAEMEGKIQALGGIYATITVGYDSVYTITSGTKGTGSKIRIADGDENNVADDLKIGTTNGGTNNDGTGNVVNLAAVTIPEMIAMAQTAGLTEVVLSDAAGKLKLESVAAGATASIVVGSGTANTGLGFTAGTTYGAQGFYSRDMPTDTYKVFGPAGESLTVGSKTTTGFTLQHNAAENLDIVVIEG